MHPITGQLQLFDTRRYERRGWYEDPVRRRAGPPPFGCFLLTRDAEAWLYQEAAGEAALERQLRDANDPYWETLREIEKNFREAAAYRAPQSTADLLALLHASYRERRAKLPPAVERWAWEVGVEAEEQLRPVPDVLPHPTRQPKLRAACDLLIVLLHDTGGAAVAALDAYAEARARGIRSERSVDTAKALLGIVSERRGWGGPVYWRWPRERAVVWLPAARALRYMRSRHRAQSRGSKRRHRR